MEKNALVRKQLSRRSFLHAAPQVDSRFRCSGVTTLNSSRCCPLTSSSSTASRIAVLATVGSLLSCSMAAFAFARMRFPGSNVIFAIILATMMIPFHVTLIPLFKLYRDIGWFGTHSPLTVPFFFGTAFGIFLMRPVLSDHSARAGGGGAH